MTSRKTIAQKLYSEFARGRANTQAEGVAFDTERELERVQRLTARRHGLSRRAGWWGYRFGLTALAQGRTKWARELLGEALRYWPFFPRALLFYMITFAPKAALKQAAGLRKSLKRRLGLSVNRP